MSMLQIDEKTKELIAGFSYGEELGFGKTMAPVMVEAIYENGRWSESKFVPYGPLQIDPAAKVLHYAQEIFEGLKAYKNESGEVYLFRPEMNAKRFNASAKRMAMPEISEEQFLESVSVFSRGMKEHVPTGMGKSLYLRPFMIATEAALGVKASDSYAYYMIGCLVESYFSKPNVRVFVETDNCRAAPGGVGFAKTGANYGASLLAFNKTKELGYDQTLWLDAAERKYVEELSGMNFFAIVENRLITPQLSDTILAGITRASILEMAKDFGLQPEEKRFDIEELVSAIDSGECSEAFACGTASVLTPIESICYKGKDYPLKRPEGEKCLAIREHFLKLQRGLAPDPHGWAHKV